MAHFRLLCAVALVAGFCMASGPASCAEPVLADWSYPSTAYPDATLDALDLGDPELWKPLREQQHLAAPTATTWTAPGEVRSASWYADELCDEPPDAAELMMTHVVVYDGGWVLRPIDARATPYELKFELHNQFRHTAFSRSQDTFTDLAGNETTIPNRNDFDINRGRLVFSGYAFDPNIKFYTNIDYSTVAEDQTQLLLSWLEFVLTERLSVSIGLVKVPGTWEWQESSRYPLGVERSMSTTFFRPSITAGVWARGEFSDELKYELMVGDGYNTFTLQAADVDTNFVYSGMMWLEPWGDFGVGFSSLGQPARPLLRLGHALTHTRTEGVLQGIPGPEQTSIRLSDGTRLVTPDALAPGATVTEFDITLYSLHAGYKFRRLSLSGEYFFRWLSNIQATGPIPDDSLFDHGYYAQAGYFTVPDRCELYTRYSAVHGEFGNGTEVAGGLNYYPWGRFNTRFTIDVAHLNDPPTEQERTGYVVGGSGTLVRTQLWTFF